MDASAKSFSSIPTCKPTILSTSSYSSSTIKPSMTPKNTIPAQPSNAPTSIPTTHWKKILRISTTLLSSFWYWYPWASFSAHGYYSSIVATTYKPQQHCSYNNYEATYWERNRKSIDIPTKFNPSAIPTYIPTQPSATPTYRPTVSDIYDIKTIVYPSPLLLHQNHLRFRQHWNHPRFPHDFRLSRLLLLNIGLRWVEANFHSYNFEAPHHRIR